MHGWKIKSGLKIQKMRGEIIGLTILYHKANKKASTLLCSVVKHLGSVCVSCFPQHFFHALPLPKCFTTEQSIVEASLFVNCVFLLTILLDYE